MINTPLPRYITEEKKIAKKEYQKKYYQQKKLSRANIKRESIKFALSTIDQSLLNEENFQTFPKFFINKKVQRWLRRGRIEKHD